MRIALMHPGRMGAAIAQRLTNAGHTVMWHPSGRSEDTHQRADAAGIQANEDLTDMLDGSEAVLCICPADVAVEVADTVARHHFAGIYVDANATSPQRIHDVAARLEPAGATVVDAIISGAPPTDTSGPRIYLANDPTATVTELFASAGLDITNLDAELGAASALKMAVASYQRSVRLLAAIAHALADEHEVTDALMREAHYFGAGPLAERDYLPSVAARAWRWEHELRDIAATLHDAGLPDTLARASADLYQSLAPNKGVWDVTPEEVLHQIKQTTVRQSRSS